jgi:DNA-directed RNA polymerase subunit RPC12/RpoP
MPSSPAQHHYPCDSCGADLHFAPRQEQLLCAYCGHVQTIPAATGRGLAHGLRELDLAAALRAQVPETEIEEIRTLRCPNCAAEIELLGHEHASQCPFCATPVVLDTGSHRQIKPQALLPFVLTQTQARAALGDWLGRLWFAPGGLQQYARRGRTITGIYSPFWTFDASSRSGFRGQRGDAYYETQWVTVRVKGRSERRQQRVRKIRWSRVSGRVARVFDDVLILGSRSLPRRFTDGLRPWDLSALQPYRPDFLSGFSAEGYTVPIAKAHVLAREEMARVIASDVRRAIGGDEQRIEQIDTDYSDETFKHVLLPVWSAAYRYRGRSYRFVINGQTGKVRGERPWSVWKIGLALLAAGIVIALALWIGQNG